jgi:FkbM family methyltransferase
VSKEFLKKVNTLFNPSNNTTQMKNQFLQNLKIRKYHVQAFSRLGSSILDRLKLAWLGWKKIDICKNKSTIKGKQWNAKLKQINNREIQLCANDDCHVGIFEEMFVYQSYDLNLLGFEPEIIIDVGAHIGLFSVAAAARWPKALILAFEPHPKNAVWARKNFEVNKVKGCVVEAVAGKESCYVDFDASSGMGYVSSCENSIRVSAIDLASLIKSFSAFSLLLKMDIEGGEKDLLPIILPCLPYINSVYVELHGTLSECEKMLEVISSYGFEIHSSKHRQSEDAIQHYIDVFVRPIKT